MDEIVKIVRENPNVNHALAVLSEKPDSVLSALDSTGGNLVFVAVQRPSDHEALEIVKYLIETRGVCRADATDFNQQTALFFAARDGHVQCVRFLIEKGCNPHHADSAGQTALFYAARDGREPVVALLLDNYDMEINTTDRVGQSALFYAAREGHRKIVEKMLQSGANPTLRDWQKKCAHAYAQRRGHLDLAAYLKSLSTETRAAEEYANSRIKRKSGVGDPRSRYLLQYAVHLPSGDIWLFAHVDKVKEFEASFPSLAAWSQISQTGTLPTDSFRMDWAREALQIVHIVSNYQDGWLFTKPVDTKAWNCPDYYDVVKHPRDLTMLKRKLRGLKYLSVQTFLHDLDLMFTNCFLYNSENTYVHMAGQKVQAFCNSLLDERNFLQWVEKENQLVKYLQENGIGPVPIGPEAAAQQESEQAMEEPMTMPDSMDVTDERNNASVDSQSGEMVSQKSQDLENEHLGMEESNDSAEILDDTLIDGEDENGLDGDDFDSQLAETSQIPGGLHNDNVMNSNLNDLPYVIPAIGDKKEIS